MAAHAKASRAYKQTSGVNPIQRLLATQGLSSLSAPRPAVRKRLKEAGAWPTRRPRVRRNSLPAHARGVYGLHGQETGHGFCASGSEEASDGDLIRAGEILVAPGGHHLRVFQDDNGRSPRVSRDNGPPVHGVRPAVDVTLADVAYIYGNRLMVVILSGMGSDGAQGAKEGERSRRQSGRAG